MLFIRNKELNKEEIEIIRKLSREKAIDFLFVIDLLEIEKSPKDYFDRVIWFKAESLLKMAEIPESKIPSWLGRFILIQMDSSFLAQYLPYKPSSGSGEDAPFYGRRVEIRSLIGNSEFPGGTITGAHKSGKTSLLYKMKEKSDSILSTMQNEKFIVLGPITLGDSGDLNRFLEKTLKSIGIDINEITLDKWNSSIREYSDSKRCPVLLLDDADPFIRSDMESGFRCGWYIRSLHYENKCKFYFSGHENLREAR